MKVSKKELVKALEEVKPGLANKDVIAQSTSFVFVNNTITTFNDEICITKPFDADFEGAIRGNELHGLLNKIKGDELEFKVDGNELIVESGKAKAGMTLESEIVLPIDEIFFDKDDFVELSEDFINAVTLASYCAARDMSKPHLTCVYITEERVVAADDFRIIEVSIPGEDYGDVLIPATSISVLNKYPVTKFHADKGWAHFMTDDGLVFTCRTIAGVYPDVSEFLKVEGVELKFPNATLDILDTAGVFTKDSADNFVTITIESRKMLIRADGDFGWFEESCNCSYKGDSIEFSIEPAFLFDILKDLNKCIVGDNALLFKGDDFDHVISLVG